MTHVSTKTIDSKAFPGVRFVIKLMTKRRTDALDELQAAPREKLRPIYEEFTPLNDAWREAGDAKAAFPDDKLKRWSELWRQISQIEKYELEPTAARFCLVRIEELDITYPDANGTDQTSHATLALILEHGPDELYREILEAIKRECGLLPEEAENLNLPSTSAAPVDGKPESAVTVETLETTIASAA